MEQEKNENCNSDKLDKLITALRTAIDKEANSYNDIFDAFRLALKFTILEKLAN